MPLTFTATGVDPTHQAHGQAAAEQVFASSGLTAEAAWTAFLELAQLKAQGKGEHVVDPSPALLRAAKVWQLAETAALAACFGVDGRSDKTRSARLTVRE